MLTRATPRNNGTYRKFKPLSLSADLLACVVGLVSCFSVRAVGILFLAEIAFILLVPILLLFKARNLLRPGTRMIFLLMGLWLFGQTLTDIYRRTALLDRLRGDAAILFLALDLLGLILLLAGHERRKVLFITGYAIGSLLAARYQPTEISFEAPWKFGYANGTILLVVMISCYFFRRRSYLIVGFLLTAIAAVNLILNFRSPVLFLLITMTLILPIVPEQVGRIRLLPRRGNNLRLVALAAMALASGLVAFELVHLVTAAGVLGEEAEYKNQMESQSKVGLLLAGRPEILVSSRAVMKSPILGYGSWARNLTYVEMMVDIQNEWGLQADIQDAEDNRAGLIPAHSHLMGAWVWSGILGAIFWLYILTLVPRAIVRVNDLQPSLSPIYVWCFISLFWNILFSPFGSTARMFDALTIVLMLDIAEYSAKAVRRSLSAPYIVGNRPSFQRRYSRYR